MCYYHLKLKPSNTTLVLPLKALPLPALFFINTMTTFFQAFQSQNLTTIFDSFYCQTYCFTKSFTCLFTRALLFPQIPWYSQDHPTNFQKKKKIDPPLTSYVILGGLFSNPEPQFLICKMEEMREFKATLLEDVRQQDLPFIVDWVANCSKPFGKLFASVSSS